MRRIVFMVVFVGGLALALEPAAAGQEDDLAIETLEFARPCDGRAGCDEWHAEGTVAGCDEELLRAVYADSEPLPADPGIELQRMTFVAGPEFNVEFTFEFDAPYGTMYAAIACESGGTIELISDVVQAQNSSGSGGGTTDPSFSVDPGQTPPSSGPTSADVPHERAAISASVRQPGDPGVGAPEYLAALLVATGVALLIVFPAALFNSTFEEHYDEVTGWFRRGRFAKPKTDAGGDGERRTSPVAFGAVLAITTLLYGLLDPNLGFDAASAAQLIGIGASLVVLTFVTGALSGAYIRWRTGDADAHLEAFPWAIGVAALCVVVSRVLDFQPGYLYGVIGGLAFAAALSTRDDGRSKAAAALALLVISLAAWFIWSPVADAAAKPDPSFLTIVADGLLGAIVVAGIEGLVLGLIPLRFLPGESVARWSRGAWLALFLGGLFLYAHVLVRPAVGDDTAPGPSVATAVGLFVGFAIVSVGFWGYFRLRSTRDRDPEGEPADAA